MDSMDGQMPTSNTTYLPLSDPDCNTNDCLAFWAAGNASQAATPWAAQCSYGHWTTWYYLALIILFAVVYMAQQLHDRWLGQSTRDKSTTSILQKTFACWRYFSYRHASGRFVDAMGLPSFGTLSLLLISTLFLCLLTFVARPYYREHEFFGSPPLAIRTGLMAFACCPILVALAGKVNLVTLLTGIGHEKLNVLHQWVGWFCLILSIIHTIPFFVAPVQDPYDNLYFEFYGYGEISATMRCTSSCNPRRNGRRFNPLCAPSHVRDILRDAHYPLRRIPRFAFLARRQSARLLGYLWATLALFVLSACARALWYILPGLPRKTHHVEAAVELSQLPGGMSQLKMYTSRPLRHSPMQHCFLRVPSISAFQSHPFTIASAPPPAVKSSQSPDREPQPLLFLIRTRAGLTKSLAQLFANDDKTPVPVSVWIDGPYGGINRRLENLYYTLVLVAGGAGITGCLPWLSHIVNVAASPATTTKRLRTTRIVLIWVVRREEHLSWVDSELDRCTNQAPSTLQVDIKLYVSGPGRVAEQEQQENPHHVDHEVKVQDVVPSNLLTFTPRRPHLRTLLEDVMEGPKVMVLCCGPESLKVDVSNTCASTQRVVLQGGLQEIALHVEEFGW